jgi:hypothetical protein
MTEDPREKFRRPLQRPGQPAGAADHAPQRPGLPVPMVRPEDVPAPSGGGLARMLQVIGRILAPKPPDKAETTLVAPGEPQVFTVMVAALANDADGRHAMYLLRSLEGRVALKVKPLPRVFQLDTMEDPAVMASALATARLAAANDKADLVVWGDVTREGYRLRLTTAGGGDDDRAGSFGMTTRVELPVEFSEPAANMLYAAVFAAAEAVGEAQKGAVRRLLPPAASVVESLAAKPPIQMAMTQQRSVQIVFGHIAAIVAQSVPPSQSGPWFEKALGSYRAAVKRVARTDPAWETGLLHRHIAAVLMAQAERTKDSTALLQEAVTEWRLAAESVTRAVMPQEWAAMQTRLGKALYRLDLKTGDSDLLREALQALQAALQVYSRTETPLKWADIMHDIAQVLEVYGDQLKNVGVLRRSVEACESVLQVLTRERMPLTWGATQNTLGSALFLLDKHSDGTANLDAAAEALERAVDVFRTSPSKGLAQVAARNLAHVHKLAEERRGRQIADPHWAGTPGPRRR